MKTFPKEIQWSIFFKEIQHLLSNRLANVEKIFYLQYLRENFAQANTQGHPKDD